MRLERLIINNFRQYRNREFTFPKKAGRPDVHIIVAGNGVGKTNMLNAIKWCLFEVEPHLSNKNAASPRLNKAEADSCRVNGQKTGNLQVTLEFSLEDIRYRITRKEDYNISPNTESPIGTTLIVMQLENNKWITINNDDAKQSIILKLVPQLIQDYIFFDGEQLSKYFRADQQTKVRNGVKGLTQVSMLEDIIKRISRYQTSNISPKLMTSGDDKLSRAIEFYNQKLSDYENKTKEIEMKQAEIESYESKIADLSDKIQGFELVKPKQEELERLEQLQKENEAKKQTVDNDRMKLVCKYYKLFGIWPAIKSYLLFLKEQERKGNLPPKFDKTLLESIISSGHCQLCDRDIDEHGKNYIESLLSQFNTTETYSRMNQTLPVLYGAMNDMNKFEEDMSNVDRRFAEVKRESQTLSNSIQKIKDYLMQIPNADEIKQNIIYRDQMQRDIEQARIDLGRLQEEQRVAKRQMDAAESKKQDLQGKNEKLATLNRQDQFCEDCVRILTETCEEILQEHRESLSRLTIKFFKQFLWKQDTFESVEIKDNFEFFLYNDKHQQVLGSCSAAEISLLALSFTLALQKDTHNDSLLYIDTPVGNVDEKNRTNFMEVLMNIAKDKQVILTFTPSEYDINIRQVVNNRESSFCKMSIEDGINIII